DGLAGVALLQPDVAVGGDDPAAAVARARPGGEPGGDGVHLRVAHELRLRTGARRDAVGLERLVPGGAGREPAEVHPLAVGGPAHLRGFAAIELGTAHNVAHGEVEA